MMWIAIFTFFLYIGYFIYGLVLEKNWKIDIFRDQSSWQEDESIISHFGLRYVQLAQMAVFLSFEALLSAVYGYVYGLAYVCWLIIGTTFFGGALSYYGGMYALRHRGYSLNYVIRQKFGTVAHALSTLLLLGLIGILLSVALTSFSAVYHGLWNFPEHLLLFYCGAVALFFCFCSSRQMAVLFSGVGIFAFVTMIILLGCSKWQLQFVEYGAHNFVSQELKYAYPLCFFVVAMGSVNCLQGLQASVLAPMIKNEKVGRKIFFGASALQAFLLIMFNVLLAAWNPNISEFYASMLDNETPYTYLQNMAYGAGGKKAALLLFFLAMALFLSFVGVMSRLARNLIAETKIGKIKFVAGAVALFLVVVPSFWLKNYEFNYAYVMIYAQSAGLLSCYLLAKYLKDQGKKYRHLIWPALLVGGALLAYVMLILLKLDLFISDIAGLAVLLLPCFGYYLSKHRESLKAGWKNYQMKHAEAQKIAREKREEKRLQKIEEKRAKEEKAALKKEQKALAKKQKDEIKKQEKENQKKASLALLMAQDETEGSKGREFELEKEIAFLQAERAKIESRVKEIEQELEKEQSKRLLLETSESVVKEIERQENATDFIELDAPMVENTNNEKIDLNTIIEEVEQSEENENNSDKFDFGDDADSFEFVPMLKETDTKEKKTSAQPEQQSGKKKRKRKKKNANKNQAS